MFKGYRRNSDFQLRYFVAGACHTADGRWFTLHDQLQERLSAAANADLEREKWRAREMRLQKQLTSTDSADRIEAAAELEAYKRGNAVRLLAREGLDGEIDFIKRLLEEIEPATVYVKEYRKGGLSFDSAAQAAQQEEWKRELVFRAECYLGTQGSIPHDHFAAMRRHPDFETAIRPAIQRVCSQLRGQWIDWATAPSGTAEIAPSKPG